MIEEKYNDFNQEDKYGFWTPTEDGFYMFNRPGKDGTVGTIVIGRVTSAPGVNEKDFDASKVYYRLNSLEHPTGIVIDYMSSQEPNPSDPFAEKTRRLTLLDWEFYREALRRWSHAESDIQWENLRYLDEKLEATKEAKFAELEAESLQEESDSGKVTE